MRITQGTFSFLPDLSDEQISRQVEYCLGKGWAIGLEYTDDPHPRNTFWEMFGNPMFDIKDAAGVMLELAACRKTFPQQYIRVTAFDSTHGTESVVMSFIVNRPSNEPGFRLIRPRSRAARSATASKAMRCRRGPKAAGTDRNPPHGDCRSYAWTPPIPRHHGRCRDRAEAALRVLGREGAARPARRRVDRAGAGQGPHPRHRGAALDRQAAPGTGAAVAAALAAHVVHGQPGHRQDHGGDAHGRGAQAAGLCAQGPPGGGDARRPGGPVHRPHGAQDQGSDQEGDGRRAVHRRGLLPLPARERTRLRAGGHRDFAAGDGEPARRPGGDSCGLQGPHGDLLRQQPGHGLAHCAPHRLSGLQRGRADADRAAHARAAELQLRRRRGLHLLALREPAPAAAALCQCALDPQCARPHPAAPRHAPVRQRRGADARAALHAAGAGHPGQPRLPSAGGSRAGRRRKR